MSTNQYLAFGTGGGAYVLSPTSYAGLAARGTGFPAGMLPKENINTPLRQSSVVAAMIGQFIADGGTDALDDGSPTNLEAGFNVALLKKIAGQMYATFLVYNGNPNGAVAGTQGNPATSTFPSVVWDILNNIWWVCSLTGDATHAKWADPTSTGSWPFWCGVGGGTGNATLLTPPVAMTSMGSGTSVSWQISANNTGASTLQVSGFGGAYALDKEGVSGPTALVGGELVAGNIAQAQFDGAKFLLISTALGTASLANASSSTGVVSAVSGSGALTPGNLAVFKDAAGTLEDGGPANVAPAPTFMDVSKDGTVLPASGGVFLVDTRGGAFTLKLTPTPHLGVSCQFIDAFGSWSAFNLTVDPNGSTMLGGIESLICNVSGEVFRVIYDATNTTWTLE